MATKLWDKGFSVDEKIEKFTVGKDRELDLYLAEYDIIGTIAHIKMLESVGLLKNEELTPLLDELENLLTLAKKGKFVIEEGVEDVHSQVELMLTRKLGDIGKKVHTGRSRNDQVLVDMKLFTRAEIKKTIEKIKSLFDILQTKSEDYKTILMPGYTHLQVAMPSSFGMWFGAYAESLCDDMLMMTAAYKVANQNPLGSAAGYGSTAPLNRKMTTELLGFEDLNYNSVYAQMSRGKMERQIAFAYASVAETLSRFAFDCCLYNSQNFRFITLPDKLTTGSSIMPHKKNPDVFELIRAHCNKLNAMPETIRMITSNLPSGYFRDMQITKEVFMLMFKEMDDCLDICIYAIENIKVQENLMEKPEYQVAFSVDVVNRMVKEGTPFRDAYKLVGMELQNNNYSILDKHSKIEEYTHEGSIGNLCNEEIKQKMERILSYIEK